MSAHRSGARVARWAGLLTGLGLTVAAFVAWQIPASGHALGADITIIAIAPGEVLVRPVAPVLAARGIVAGQERSGRMTVTNITGKALEIRVRALPSSRDLDRSVELTITDGARTVAGGTLAELRRWSGRRLRLPVRSTHRLVLRAVLRAGAEDSAGRVVDVSLELGARTVGS